MSKLSAGDYILVAVDKVGCGIEFVDVQTRKSLKRLTMPSRPHEIVIAPDEATAYVTIYGDGIYGNNVHRGHQIAIIDLKKQELAGFIDIRPYQAPHGLTWDANGKLWITVDKSRHVLCVDPETRTIEDAVACDTDGCHWVVATQGGKKIYTSNKDTDNLCVIDPTTRKLVKRVTVPNGTEGIDSSRNGKWIYTSDHKDPKLIVIDTHKDEIKQTIDLRGYKDISFWEDHEMRVRTTLDDKYVVISGYKWDVAVIVDAVDPENQTLLQTKKGPMGFGFPPFDVNQVYLADHDSGSISVIDLTTKQFVESFPCGTGVECMEFILAK
jgi:DNA-binding beta-propeller fold protein YncE